MCDLYDTVIVGSRYRPTTGLEITTGRHALTGEVGETCALAAGSSAERRAQIHIYVYSGYEYGTKAVTHTDVYAT